MAQEEKSIEKQEQKTVSSQEDELFFDILVTQNYLEEEDFLQAIKEAQEKNTETLDYLLQTEKLNKDILGQAVSEYYQVPYADLDDIKLPDKYTKYIPYQIAYERRVVVYKIKKDRLCVATDKIAQEGLEKVLQEILPKYNISIAYTLPENIELALHNYKSSLDTRFSKILEQESVQASDLLEEIFRDALVFKASDIHFEPAEEEVMVRFRIDGVLQDVGKLPKGHYQHIVNRIKVQSKLRIDKHNQMQDGAMRYTGDGETIDIRVSIAPTLGGEKVAIRLLANYVHDFSLGGLGLTDKQQEILEAASKKPFGMILISGPTGSGKTTTLYAVLKTLNSKEVNITTIEDPVEYRIDGINQIQVREESGITFAAGLRSIVRQDPDVILVGEIRDDETNEIALNAALTGHLMLSTFHANDAATGIPRLIEMGAEPFLVASTLEVIIAQRLVRKVCANCKHSIEKSKSEITEISKEAAKLLFSDNKKHVTLFAGKGCNVCNDTGYVGRQAVFEIIEITSEMKNLITNSPASDEVRKLARKQNSMSMFENGIESVRQGKTTIEELVRVVGTYNN